MQEVLKHIEKVNGQGWLIGLVLNVVWTTLSVAALYWVLHEDVAVLKERLANQTEALREVQEQMAHQVATKPELRAMWDQGQEQHARIWDELKRKQDRTKAWTDR